MSRGRSLSLFTDISSSAILPPARELSNGRRLYCDMGWAAAYLENLGAGVRSPDVSSSAIHEGISHCSFISRMAYLHTRVQRDREWRKEITTACRRGNTRQRMA